MRSTSEADVYRTPLPAQSRTYELRKAQQEKSGNGLAKLYRFEEIVGHVTQSGMVHTTIDYEDIEFTKATQAVVNDASESNKYFRRLIEQVRTLYRPNDLGAAQNDPLTLLPLRAVESLALPGESYKLAFTPGLLDQVYHARWPADCCPQIPPVSWQAAARIEATMSISTTIDDHWWIPSGRMFHSPNRATTAAQELAYARSTSSCRTATAIRSTPTRSAPRASSTYDAYDLLMVETRDALGNVSPSATRRTATDHERQRLPRAAAAPGDRPEPQPDRGRLRHARHGGRHRRHGQAAAAPAEGDSLDRLRRRSHASADRRLLRRGRPARQPHQRLLRDATTRIVYDLDRFRRTQRRTRTTRPNGSPPAPRRSPARPMPATRCRRRA